MSKTYQFKHFSLTIDTVLVLAFVFSVVMGVSSIVTTCENILEGALWWHTAFTAVESLVFVTAIVCCILKALQPHHPGRFRAFHTVAMLACLLIIVRQGFFQYERLFLGDPNWLSWISGPFSLAGWCFLFYVLCRLRRGDIH